MLVSANIFQPLIDVFQSVLIFFHNSLGVPWGWAIVLLTIVVRAALFRSRSSSSTRCSGCSSTPLS